MVNGKETYREMYNCLMIAKEEIFISGWFISPEVFLFIFLFNVFIIFHKNKVHLIRENDNGEPISDDRFRLDNILRYKSSQGVKIYICVWNETNFASKNKFIFILFFHFLILFQKNSET